MKPVALDNREIKIGLACANDLRLVRKLLLQSLYQWHRLSNVDLLQLGMHLGVHGNRIVVEILVAMVDLGREMRRNGGKLLSPLPLLHSSSCLGFGIPFRLLVN